MTTHPAPASLALRNIKDGSFFVKLYFAPNARNRPVVASCGYYHTDEAELKRSRQRPFQLPLRAFCASSAQGTVSGPGGLRPCRKAKNENRMVFLGVTHEVDL